MLDKGDIVIGATFGQFLTAKEGAGICETVAKERFFDIVILTTLCKNTALCGGVVCHQGKVAYKSREHRIHLDKAGRMSEHIFRKPDDVGIVTPRTLTFRWANGRVETARNETVNDTHCTYLTGRLVAGVQVLEVDCNKTVFHIDMGISVFLRDGERGGYIGRLLTLGRRTLTTLEVTIYQINNTNNGIEAYSNKKRLCPHIHRGIS